MRSRWRWSVAGVVGLALAAGLFVVPALGEGPVAGEVGLLRLQLNSSGDKFVYDPASGPDLVQTLSQTSCKIKSSGDSLVSLTASSSHSSKKPFPGLKDHRIGVGQTGEGNGEPCARIDGSLGQKLTLSLTGALGGEAIGYIELDLGFKFNGSAKLELKKAGVLVDTVIVPCSGSSDCGPDSGASDNERVVLWLDPADNPGSGHWQAFQIDGVFDTIVIRPGSSSSKSVVSLEGGFNGSAPGPVGSSLGTSDSLFSVVELFDGEIDCEGSVTLGGGVNATHEITRGKDTNGGCKGPEDGLLFNFEAGIEEGRKFVDFVTEPVDGDASTMAQFLEVITWTFGAPPNVEIGGQFIPISYDDHVGDGIRDMPWCLKDPRVGGSLPSPVITTTILPAGHTSCLIESNSHVTLLGEFVSVDTVYNIGDGKRYK